MKDWKNNQINKKNFENFDYGPSNYILANIYKIVLKILFKSE